MKILLLGRTGQVGFELYRTLAPLGTVVAPSSAELDLLDEAALSRCLNTVKPALIVNAAAWTAVDNAEKQRTEAERLNAGVPEQLAAYAAAECSRLVHYSSDYVYKGTGQEILDENSPTGPLSYYGKTKLAGDEAIARTGVDNLNFRTSWVYSARGSNFMKTILRLARSKTELEVVSDQVGAPTPARLIAQVTSLAIHNKLESGLYHLAPSGQTNWHGFAKEIVTQAAELGENLALSSENIRAVSTSAYPTPAARPLNSRLNISRLQQALGITLPDWKSQLALTLTEYLER